MDKKQPMVVATGCSDAGTPKIDVYVCEDVEVREVFILRTSA